MIILPLGVNIVLFRPFNDYDFTAVAFIEEVPALQAREKQFSHPLVSSSPNLTILRALTAG